MDPGVKQSLPFSQIADFLLGFSVASLSARKFQKGRPCPAAWWPTQVPPVS